jgi:hypothetical protein
MKKHGLLTISLITAVLLIVGMMLSLNFFWLAPAQNLLAASSSTNQVAGAPAAAGLADVSGPIGTPPADLPSDELPPPNLDIKIDSISALPTPIPGDTLLYFVPTDSDATATVIYLYNTEAITRTVPLRGFSYNGILVYSLNIAINPNSFLRLSSDSIASAPPPSWATPAPIITNFTDFTYFASLSLPKGVKAEGYVLFNPGTGVVDPRQDQGGIPLRFSTDPATLFLPTITGSP